MILGILWASDYLCLQNKSCHLWDKFSFEIIESDLGRRDDVLVRLVSVVDSGSNIGKTHYSYSGPCHGLTTHPGGSKIFLVASCYRSWDKLRTEEPLGSNAVFTYPPTAQLLLSCGLLCAFLIWFVHFLWVCFLEEATFSPFSCI